MDVTEHVAAAAAVRRNAKCSMTGTTGSIRRRATAIVRGCVGAVQVRNQAGCTTLIRQLHAAVAAALWAVAADIAQDTPQIESNNGTNPTLPTWLDIKQR